MDLKLGSTGPLVFEAQELLYDQLLSFSIGVPYRATGTFDRTTEASVKIYQSSIGLEPTGVIDDLTSTCLTRSTFQFEVGHPPTVAQPENKDHCWAAATSSWLEGMNRPTKFSTQQLVDMFKTIPGALELSDESITNSGWLTLKNKFKLDFHGFGSSMMLGKGSKLNDFNATYLLKMLKSKKYLLLAYNYNEFIGHTVVPYGLLVRFKEGELKPEYMVKVMDPLEGQRIREEINTFKFSGAVMIFYAR
jgi:hypothetical protein